MSQGASHCWQWLRLLLHGRWWCATQLYYRYIPAVVVTGVAQEQHTHTHKKKKKKNLQPGRRFLQLGGIMMSMPAGPASQVRGPEARPGPGSRGQDVWRRSDGRTCDRTSPMATSMHDGIGVWPCPRQHAFPLRWQQSRGETQDLNMPTREGSPSPRLPVSLSADRTMDDEPSIPCMANMLRRRKKGEKEEEKKDSMLGSSSSRQHGTAIDSNLCLSRRTRSRQVSSS